MKIKWIVGGPVSYTHLIFAAYDMDVPSAKRFITSLLESRVEEGRSVSYITSAKKKDEDKLMFTELCIRDSVNANKATGFSFALLIGFFYAGDMMLKLFQVDIASFAVAEIGRAHV